jgi:receptor protein-tyrosine kinase
LRGYFDFIVLDSSPILPVADATILSSKVDGTILVEREFVSQRSNVHDALTRLDSAGGELMGTVFVGSKELSKYGCGYGYGYMKKQYS